MSPVSQPIDHDVLTGFRAGDESSLERLFRERYPALTEEARSQFGDAAAGHAPRVVERAFVRAWEQRTRFETPEALDSFLHECVHEGVVRERSRIAGLHRIDGQGGRAAAHATRAPDAVPVDEAWKHVSTMLHPATANAAIRHQALDESRHHAAEHLARTGKRRPIAVPLAIAAVVGLAILGALWWVDRSSEDAAVSAALAAPDAAVISSGAGQIGSTTLRDGSTVKLGPDTKLTRSVSYGTNLRAVKLEGAASFQVAPGKVEPFAVRVRDHTIMATGTAFDVTAYPREPAVFVRVREGSVTLKVDGEPHPLSAGQAVRITDDNKIEPASGAVLDEAVAWSDGKFVVANRPLREALALMTRWYRIELQVRDSSLLTRPVSASASLESSREAIAAIEKSANLKFDYEGKTMVLRDAAAPAPKQ
jgi:transmembrane sensor